MDTKRRMAMTRIGAGALALLAGSTKKASAAPSGIATILLVTQQRAQSANDEATKGADAQRELIKREKDRRASELRAELVKALEKQAKLNAELVADLKRVRDILANTDCK